MQFAIPARFLDAFLKGFTRSAKELVIHGLILLATLVYWLRIGGIKAHFWEGAAPWLWALCTIVAWHLLKAAYLLDKEIGSNPSLGASTIVSEYGKPFDLPVAQIPFYRVKVWGIAVVGVCLCSLFAVLVGRVASPSDAVNRPTPTYPPPKGPGIRFEGNTPIPSSEMCIGLSGEQQDNCFCPRTLAYALKALPPPPDNNYATEIIISDPPDQFQRIRVFLRAMITSANLTEIVPDDKSEKSVTTLGLLAYDKFSFVIQSTAPKISYKVVVHSSEQMRLRCISFEN